jgi:hypothetical protein
MRPCLAQVQLRNFNYEGNFLINMFQHEDTAGQERLYRGTDSSDWDPWRVL